MAYNMSWLLALDSVIEMKDLTMKKKNLSKKIFLFRMIVTRKYEIQIQTKYLINEMKNKNNFGHKYATILLQQCELTQ